MTPDYLILDAPTLLDAFAAAWAEALAGEVAA